MNTSRNPKTSRKSWLALAAAAGLAALVAAPSARADGRDRDRHDHHDDGPKVSFGLRIGDARPRVETVRERVWVEPEYRTVSDRVWCEPVFRTVTERVWCPARFEFRTVETRRGHRIYRETTRVEVEPGHYEERTRQELVSAGYFKTVERIETVSEGHWEERVVETRRRTESPSAGLSIRIRD